MDALEALATASPLHPRAEDSWLGRSRAPKEGLYSVSPSRTEAQRMGFLAWLGHHCPAQPGAERAARVQRGQGSGCGTQGPRAPIKVVPRGHAVPPLTVQTLALKSGEGKSTGDPARHAPGWRHARDARRQEPMPPPRCVLGPSNNPFHRGLQNPNSPQLSPQPRRRAVGLRSHLPACMQERGGCRVY